MTDLRQVETAARKSAEARDQLERAIRHAHAEGASLRAIALAASMSHESVRSLIRSDQT